MDVLFSGEVFYWLTISDNRAVELCTEKEYIAAGSPIRQCETFIYKYDASTILGDMINDRIIPWGTVADDQIIEKLEAILRQNSLSITVKEFEIVDEPVIQKHAEIISNPFDPSQSIYERFERIRARGDYDAISPGPVRDTFERIIEAISGQPYKFVYRCSSNEQVVFSILHFLILHKYNKARKCVHCEKWFIYKTSSKKYCSRISPYKDNEEYTCKDMTDNTIRDASAKKVTVEKKLRSRLDTILDADAMKKREDDLNAFLNGYEKHIINAKERPITKHLEELEQFLTQWGRNRM